MLTTILTSLMLTVTLIATYELGRQVVGLVKAMRK